MGLFDGFNNLVNDGWKTVSSAAGSAGDAIKGGWDATVKTVSSAAGSAGDAIKGGWDAVADRAKNASSTTSPFQSLQNLITGSAGDAKPKTEFIQQTAPVVIKQAADVVKSAPQIVADIPKNVVSAVSSIGGDFSAGVKKYAPYALAGAGVILALKILR